MTQSTVIYIYIIILIQIPNKDSTKNVPLVYWEEAKKKVGGHVGLSVKSSASIIGSQQKIPKITKSENNSKSVLVLNKDVNNEKQQL